MGLGGHWVKARGVEVEVRDWSDLGHHAQPGHDR